jgi:hypothetical protein
METKKQLTFEQQRQNWKEKIDSWGIKIPEEQFRFDEVDKPGFDECFDNFLDSKIETKSLEKLVEKCKDPKNVFFIGVNTRNVKLYPEFKGYISVACIKTNGKESFFFRIHMNKEEEKKYENKKEAMKMMRSAGFDSWQKFKEECLPIIVQKDSHDEWKKDDNYGVPVGEGEGQIPIAYFLKIFQNPIQKEIVQIVIQDYQKAQQAWIENQKEKMEKKSIQNSSSVQIKMKLDDLDTSHIKKEKKRQESETKKESSDHESSKEENKKKKNKKDHKKDKQLKSSRSNQNDEFQFKFNSKVEPNNMIVALIDNAGGNKKLPNNSLTTTSSLMIPTFNHFDLDSPAGTSRNQNDAIYHIGNLASMALKEIKEKAALEKDVKILEIENESQRKIFEEKLKTFQAEKEVEIIKATTREIILSLAYERDTGKKTNDLLPDILKTKNIPPSSSVPIYKNSLSLIPPPVIENIVDPEKNQSETNLHTVESLQKLILETENNLNENNNVKNISADISLHKKETLLENSSQETNFPSIQSKSNKMDEEEFDEENNSFFELEKKMEKENPKNNFIYQENEEFIDIVEQSSNIPKDLEEKNNIFSKKNVERALKIDALSKKKKNASNEKLPEIETLNDKMKNTVYNIAPNIVKNK